jgi:hypothetical protein
MRKNLTDNNIDSPDIISQRIIDCLDGYGIHFESKTGQLTVNDMRLTQYQLSKQTNTNGLKFKDEVKVYFATPDEINIQEINPYLVAVVTEQQRRIWAYATTFWSIPVTTGFGRRVRFLVFDEYNDKLIGIVGLTDPLIGLGIRDEFIGWDKDQKVNKLYNCMTAYILGAVPPYNSVLGSKLIALTLMFPEVRHVIYDKYKNSTPLISGVKKEPHLVYVDTMGAFGKSAIYNRLMNWRFVGYTKGQSHIHITSNESWEIIKQLIPEEKFKTYKYGQGSNWKMRVLKNGLEAAGLSKNILNIGWQRGYYCCPLAENWQEYLLGKTNNPEWKNYTKSDLIGYWKEKWVIPRIDKLKEKLDK